MRLTDTRNCPLGHRCESCGQTSPGLAVKVLSLPEGVICLTLCPLCAASSVDPPLQPSTAVRFALQHRAHVETEKTPDGRHRA